MKEDEPKNDWVDQTLHWTWGVLSCSIGDECLWVVDQARDHISGENISEQSLIDEKASKLKILSGISVVEHTSEF